MIPRLFCHTWILLTGSSYPKFSPDTGGCCLLAPSIHTLHPGPVFLPLTILRSCQKVWPGLTPQCREPLSGSTALSAGSCGTQPCPPFPERAHLAVTLGFCSFLHPCVLWLLQALSPCSSQACKRMPTSNSTEIKHNTPSSAMFFVCSAPFQQCVTEDGSAMWA